MRAPSQRSRSERPSEGRRPTASDANRSTAGPAEKKHKNLSEVQRSGRQSDQGGRPGRSSSRRG
jgi:hypothetical protein